MMVDPYGYDDYEKTLRTNNTQTLLHQMDREAIVLLENRNSVLPLNPKSTSSIALIGPHAGSVAFGDYVFFNASLNGISPVDGVKRHLAAVGSGTTVNYAEGCKLWSNDESGFAEAVDAAKKSDVAVVVVGTCSLDQTLLWTPGTNATTGEHIDVSDLGLVGAQRALVQAVVAAGKPTVVVFQSGKPMAEPWIAARTSLLFVIPICMSLTCEPSKDRRERDHPAILPGRARRARARRAPLRRVLPERTYAGLRTAQHGHRSGVLQLPQGRAPTRPRHGHGQWHARFRGPVCARQPGSAVELRAWAELCELHVVCPFLSSPLEVS